MMLNHIEGSTHKAESIKEKAFLINAAKQFKEIIIETKNLDELPQNL
jgi:hypothetical protein